MKNVADYAIHDTTLIGISNVIRKKEGSSALIDPAEYADRVNLMGMLEEKTASSASVCSFSDGADDVPMSSVVAHIAPTLTGTNAVNMVQSGKNLIKPDKYQTAGNNLALGQNDGTSFGTFLKAGTYTISYETTGETCYIYRREENDASNTNMGKKLSTNFTLESDGNFRFWLYGDGAVSANISNVQIEVGSTPTQYTAYEAPTTYTANLGRTVYGADVDLMSGQGTETHSAKIDMGTLNWKTGSVSGGVGFRFYCNFEDIKRSTSQVNEIVLAEGYDSVTANETYQKVKGVASDTGSQRVVLYDGDYSTVEDFKQAVSGKYLVYPLDTGTSFTFDGQEIPSLLGVNNLWHEAGNTEAVYRSSGTVTPVPVVPTLISKTITENGTYSAEDDNADGYSEVTVNVQGGETPFVPQFSETLIGDNTAHASSFTLTEDYGNYDMVKIVWYESATSSGFLYTTPDILDEIFSVGAGKLCINKPSTNYYVCYTKSGLTWTQTNQRNIYVHEVYGVTFTNCTMQATDLYKRGASTTTKYAVTSQTSLKDYDLFMMSSIHNTDGSETMPTTWLYQYPKENMSDAFSCPVPAVLQEYNANDEAFVITEYGMTSARYFMVQGIKFTQTQSLLSMSPAPVSQEESEEEEE